MSQTQYVLSGEIFADKHCPDTFRRYDFAVFGYFSDVLGDVFFPPHQDGHAAIVESFAVFGGAFFMRPS